MTYNRCVVPATCANNCPLQVRRFNWFSYYSNEFETVNGHMFTDLGRMVLNPDVTVRAVV
jgi:molybdopterin-containing oxidoreductase family iron-sulfur binding subunit